MTVGKVNYHAREAESCKLQASSCKTNHLLAASLELRAASLKLHACWINLLHAHYRLTEINKSIFLYTQSLR